MAKHYGVSVVACPPRRGNRKGSVEKSIHFATQRFWRTMTRDDHRRRPAPARPLLRAHRRPAAPSVAKLEELVGKEARRRRSSPRADAGARRVARPGRARAAAAPSRRLLPGDGRGAQHRRALAPSWPSRATPTRCPPGLIGAEVTVRHRLGTAGIEIVSGAGVLLASHHRETPGGGYVVRDPAHKAALEHVVLAAFTTDPPCRRKANRPPGDGGPSRGGQAPGRLRGRRGRRLARRLPEHRRRHGRRDEEQA